MGVESQDEDPLAWTNSGRLSRALSHGRAQAAFDSLLAYLHDKTQSTTSGIIDRAEQSYVQSSAPRSHPGSSRIRDELYQRLLKALTTPPQKKVVALNEMQTLSEESMRVTLARTQLINIINKQARDELLGLRARLQALQQAGVFIIPQALLPGHLIDGLLQTLNDLQLPQQLQAQIMEAYCALNAAPLCEAYRGANQLLMQQRILPDYVVTDLKNISSSHFSDITQNQYELEQKFIQLQEAFCGMSFSDWRPGLLARLLDAPPRYNPPEAQQQAFDRVERSFIALLGDARTSERIRTEIHRLALSALTMHLNAPDQAASPHGPLHTFMQQLTLLGHRDRESPLHEFDNIKILASRIISEHGRETSGFLAGSEVLFTISKSEIKRRMAGHEYDPLSITQSRGIKVENNDAAKQQVTEELRKIVKGLTIPREIMPVVLKMLAPWMMSRLQRYGIGSIAWAEAKTWVAMFFDLMRPASSREEYSRLQIARHRTLEEIQLRAERSNMPPAERAALMNSLERHFEGLNRNDRNALNISPVGKGNP